MNIISKIKQALCKKIVINFENKRYDSEITYVNDESLQYCHLLKIHNIVVEILHSNEPYKEAIFTLYYKKMPFYKETLEVTHSDLNNKIQAKIDVLKPYFKDDKIGFIEKIATVISKKLKGSDYKDGYFFYYYVQDVKNDKKRHYISCLNNGGEYFKIYLPEKLDEDFIDSIEHFEGDDVIKYMDSTSHYYDKFNCKVVLKILPIMNNNSIYVLNLFNQNIEKDIALVDLASRKGKGVLVLDMEHNDIDSISIKLNENPNSFQVNSVKSLGELSNDKHETEMLYNVSHKDITSVKDILAKIFINEFFVSDIGEDILIRYFLKQEYIHALQAKSGTALTDEQYNKFKQLK
jgi:hypothetical protein